MTTPFSRVLQITYPAAIALAAATLAWTSSVQGNTTATLPRNHSDEPDSPIQRTLVSVDLSWPVKDGFRLTSNPAPALPTQFSENGGRI